MAITLGQAPQIKTTTLADGNVVAIVGNGSVSRISLYVDSGGANVAVAYSGQTDGNAPSGSDYLSVAAGGGVEELDLRPGDTVYIWRLSATSTTVRIATGRGRGT